MRMKFNNPLQLLAVSAGSLLAATLISACGTLTVDFVYVTTAKAAGPNNYGEVNVFEINSQSGRMRQIPTSPFPSGGRNPVAATVSADEADLYVVNRDDNTIVQFIIGSDGKLYPQNTVNTPGVFPLAATVSGNYLYAVDLYQPLPTCNPASPCSGSVAVFPILTSAQAGSLTPAQPANTLLTKTPINSCNGLDYLPLILPGSAASHVFQPTAGTVASGSNFFVTGYDTTTNLGYVFGFAVGTMSCPNNATLYQTIPTLTPLAGSPLQVGNRPSAVASDPGGNYLYITDAGQSEVFGYQINGGNLIPVNGSPFPSGSVPSAIVVDAAGKYALVASSQDSNLIVYSINTGSLTRLGTYATGTQPVAIGIDPSLNQYVFTANFLGNNVSGFQLNATDGSLLNSQFSPYASNVNPTAVAAITHNQKKK
jgi:6-phosphogluconolactonase (cycloisomerase 2 family)